MRDGVQALHVNTFSNSADIKALIRKAWTLAECMQDGLVTLHASILKWSTNDAFISVEIFFNRQFSLVELSGHTFLALDGKFSATKMAS